jgi:FtsH-binding integral membrane protein
VYIAAVTGLVIGVLYAKGHQSAVLKVGIAGVEILLFALVKIPLWEIFKVMLLGFRFQWMIHITRRITGGYGDISPDEYIFGALTLYVDLLLFLLFLLEIINYCRKL